MYMVKVSAGELLDKMSILEIKLDRLTGERRQECEKEYREIALQVMHHDYKYYHKILRIINEKIWDIQQNLHDGFGDPAKDYSNILDLNDQRFKIKQKINRLAQSDLQEQKSYNERKCVVYGHLGMGDMYWINGAVRFLSTIYDEVVVVCKIQNLSNVEMMYNDDPTIKTLPIQHDIPINNIINNLNDHVVIACGVTAGKGAENYPHSFYEDMDINPTYRIKYFHHAYQGMSEILLDQLDGQPFILVHENKSSQHFNIVKNLNPDRQLIINIVNNIYPVGHKFHEIASRFVKLPLSCYIALLEEAKELHLVESSLACLACHLNLEKVEAKKIYAASDQFLKLKVFEEGQL